MGTFVEYGKDSFRPEYGEVQWVRRLNQMLEAREAELKPVGYKEDGQPTQQITQENCIVYINQVADELDCVSVMYEPDGEDIWTWYFRHKFESDEMFAHVVNVVGTWATQIVTMYPLPHVVQQYEAFMDAGIPDEIPDDLV